MNNRLAKCLCLSLICWIPTLTLADNVMFIIDGSGSMWHKLGNTPKISMVRKTFQQLLPQWDAESALGIMSYGNRQRHSCQDVNTLIPLTQPISPKKINSKLKHYAALGKTPLGHAVKTAAAVLASTDTPATIVIISDGTDDCNVDLCALGKTLHNDSNTLKIHVIGLDIKPSERDSLRCLAENTNGQFFLVRNQQQLINASKKALADVFKLTEVTISVAYAEGSPIQASSAWKVYRLDDENYRTLHTQSYAPNLQLTLPQGRYVVSVRHDRLTSELEFLTHKQKTLEKTLVLDGGQIQLNAVLQNSDKPILGIWRIYKLASDGKKPIQVAGTSNTLNPAFSLPAGDYQVKVQSGLATAEQSLKVTNGTTTTETLTLQASAVTPIIQLPKEEPRRLRWIIYKQLPAKKPKQKPIQKQIFRIQHPKPTFILPQGTYQIVVHQINGFHAKHSLEVTTTATLTPQIKLLPGKP